MSAPMRKHPTSSDMIDCYTKQGHFYRIPLNIAKKYFVAKRKVINLPDYEMVDTNVLFKEMDEKYTRAGALLRGTRHREGLSQKEFAKIIEVTQSDLSKMENGKRPIGKIVAKRIEKEFEVDYRYFLG